MRKLIILLILVLAMPVIAQDTTDKGEFVTIPIEEARTQWVLDPLSIIALQAFHQRYQEDYLELIKLIKAAEMRMNPDMPETALFNDQLQAFVIPKPKEIKKQ